MKWASNCTYPRFSNNRWEFLVLRNAAQFREIHVRRGLASFCSFSTLSIWRRFDPPSTVDPRLSRNSEKIIRAGVSLGSAREDSQNGEAPRARKPTLSPAPSDRPSRSEPERTASTPDTHMFRRHGHECPRVFPADRKNPGYL